jgi:hypothetical protein
LLSLDSVAAVRCELHEPRAELKGEMTELRAELKQFVRTFIVAETTAMVGLTGIFVGVPRLL